jgi:H/ACA ribonucleoprotein complex subunit 4
VSEATGPPAPWPSDVTQRIVEGAFLLVDKPRGPSSHQVTAWVRDLLQLPRAGHAGTLDPNVSGLLWVGVGPALKLLPLLLEFPKRYIALVTFHGPVAAREVEQVVEEFRGPVYQTPPVRSAVKRERRIRTLHRLNIIELTREELLLDVVGDSGTYVRTLAVDLGEALGVGANLTELRRIGTGPFKETDSVPLSAIADATTSAHAGQTDALLALLHPIREVWREFPSLVLKDAAASAVVHGADLAAGGIVGIPRPFAKGARVVLLSRGGTALSIGTALVDSDVIGGSRAGWVVDSQRVLADPAQFPPRWGRRAAAPPPPPAPA